MFAWSKIQNTDLAVEAYIRISDNCCKYHNIFHVEQMYQYLEDTNEPYDVALDWAVLFHDVVYDDKTEKELRSAKFFVEASSIYRGFDYSPAIRARVYSLIMRTVDHVVVPEIKGSSAIIRADLHALTDKRQTVENFTKIMNESLELYDCTVDEFATNNIAVMSGLHDRMAANCEVDKCYEMFYNKVMNGIDLTIRMAQAIKEVK